MPPGFKEQVSPYEIILNELRGLKDDVHEVKTQIKEVRDELNKRMDRIETRMDRIEMHMNHIETEVRSSTRHTQILVVSIVGIAIAVIYSVLR